MNARSRSIPSIPVKKVHLVKVDFLRLDPRNPRLLGLTPEATDAEIIAQLYRSEDLGELLQSISANGYLNIEPLIVLANTDHFVVLEGNRRLAAIRLFREAELAGTVSDEVGVKISVPPIADEYRHTLDEVSVYRVARREDAWSFIGFKHINGAARWDSYAKATFAADWYRDSDTTLTNIATSDW